MSTARSGDPDNVSGNLVATVLDASNTTPIVMTTVAAHGYSDNDIVDVEGVTGNLGANGYARKITYLSPTTFSIDGSVGTGAYVAGGTVTDRSLTPTILRPDDGDLRSAASVNAAIDALADRTQFLMSALRGLGFGVDTFTANGLWSKPTLYGGQLISWAILFGWGGGGGGAGGGLASVTAGNSACGGSGGAGSHARVALCDVSGLATCAVAIGAGGNGNGTTIAGSSGGDTTFAGNTTEKWQGAGGGSIDNQAAINADRAHRGGLPFYLYEALAGTTWNARLSVVTIGDLIVQQQGAGGSSFNAFSGRNSFQGNGSKERFTPGAGGVVGGTVGGFFGGGGGGGGGAGPGGNGTAGGAGGAGNNVGIGVTGGTAAAAGANSGAGGGGGGAGGQGTTLGPSGTGGTGGSGKLYVIYPRIR